MIKLELSLDDVNKVMAALGNVPYAQVADLVENIKKQAVPQLNQPQQPEAVNTSTPGAVDASDTKATNK